MHHTGALVFAVIRIERKYLGFMFYFLKLCSFIQPFYTTLLVYCRHLIVFVGILLKYNVPEGQTR